MVCRNIASDDKRTAFLEGEGYRVLRLWNNDVLSNTEGALTVIQNALVTIPVAMVINGWRVFLTGFLVAFVDPAMGEGFMHLTEGWVLFVVAFAVLSGLTWVMAKSEARLAQRFSSDPSPPLTEAPA